MNLAVSLPKTLPPVRVDPGHLQQVLINLLTNAIEATPSGGRVQVTGLPEAYDGRPGVAIAVQDTGAGIAENVLPRIFDPFFSTKPAHEGAGLGLSICRQIMETYGGSISASNRRAPDGRVLGARFTVRVPAADGRK